MVEFFNKKEEVIDLQLTEYGKYLLSLGRFKPELYAFYDDDILYDSRCAGFTEHQNDAEGRIQENTPSLKVIRTITSAEERVGQFVANVSASYSTTTMPSSSGDIAFAFSQQSFEERVNFLSTPLGNSSIAKSYAPAWSIDVPKNNISSSVNATTIRNVSSSTYTGTIVETFVSGPVQKIPQLNFDIDYQAFVRSGEYTIDAISDYLHADIFLALKPDYIFLDILEENTDYLKENFDIEVFHSSSCRYGSGPSLSRALEQPLQPPGPKPLTPMAFMEDNSVRIPQNLDNNNNVPANVEFYMDILVDKEIPESIMAEAGVLDSTVSRTSGRMYFTRDLYTTENEEACD